MISRKSHGEILRVPSFKKKGMYSGPIHLNCFNGYLAFFMQFEVKYSTVDLV